MIKEMQREATYMDERRAAAYLTRARGTAMQDAANNPNGAMAGFMGMGMVNGMGGASEQQLFQMAQQKDAAAHAAELTAQFEAEKAALMKQAASGWACTCGQLGNTGKFCQGCGKPQPLHLQKKKQPQSSLPSYQIRTSGSNRIPDLSNTMLETSERSFLTSSAVAPPKLTANPACF